MDPMTLAAIASVVLKGADMFMGANAQDAAQEKSNRAAQQANKLAKKQFKFAKGQAKQTRQAAEGTRTDPYGNKLVWNPQTNSWEYEMTPMTSGQLASGQGEDILRLTEDATRNRDFRRRMADISRTGEGELRNVLNEYRYGQKPSEAGSIADLTRELILARGRGLDEGKASLMQNLLRMSGGASSSAIPRMLKQADEMFGGTLEEAILKGRRLGKEEYRQDTQARDNSLQGWMQKFGQMAEGQGQNVPKLTDDSLFNSLKGTGQSAINDLISALTGGASGVNNAFTSMINAAKGLGNTVGGGQPGMQLSSLSDPLTALMKQLSGGPDPNMFGAGNQNTWNTQVTPNPLYGTPEDTQFFL